MPPLHVARRVCYNAASYLQMQMISIRHIGYLCVYISVKYQFKSFISYGLPTKHVARHRYRATQPARLNAMHYQCKSTSIRSIHTIKHHHGDNGKMPGTCPVGCRYDYSKRPAHKHHHCSLKAKMLRKRKAIESQIEMIEIASPNKQCIENKQRNVLHIAERHYPLAYIQHNSLHFSKKKASASDST